MARNSSISSSFAKRVRIGNRWVGQGEPAYVIAEVGSNFDGDLGRAKILIELARDVGADAVKFQSFLPDKIISKESFKEKLSFQAAWDKPVYEVYCEAALPRAWHKELFDHARRQGIEFLSSPYDAEAVDLLDSIGVEAFKVGSGDITYLGLLEQIAGKGKPIILGTGASNLGEIEEALETMERAGNRQVVLLQCVTNYPSPIDEANLRAMVALRDAFELPVGYSDHSAGDLVALGAVALGACVIEKHFTADKSRQGPDHLFAMEALEMKSLVQKVRLLESALGDGRKRLMPAEKETVVLQRRCLYAACDIAAGQTIAEPMIEALRPMKGLPPKYAPLIAGRKARAAIKKGEPITWEKIC